MRATRWRKKARETESKKEMGSRQNYITKTFYVSLFFRTTIPRAAGDRAHALLLLLLIYNAFTLPEQLFTRKTNNFTCRYSKHTHKRVNTYETKKSTL